MEQNVNNSNEVEIDLGELLGVLISKLWIIVLVGVILAGSVGLYCKFIATPIYSSTTQLCILSKDTTLSSLADLQVGASLTQDYIVVTQSRPVVEKVINNLKLDMTYEELLATTTIENPSDTRILTITVTNPDPKMAKQIADQYAEVSRVRIAELMDIAKPGVIEEGHVAEQKTSPTTTKNAAIAGILGIILAAGVIIVIHMMDDTIRSSEDVEKHLGLNTLGILPVEEAGLHEEAREANEVKQRKKKQKKAKASKGGNQ